MAESTPENSDLESKIEALRDLPLTESDQRFKADEMTACSSCSRSNPPNRTACLYCGTPLEAASIRTELAKINYQRPEAWEDGFSLVFAGIQDLADEVIEAAAALLQIDTGLLNQILSNGSQAPLVYLKSLTDATILASQLSEKGFDCAIVGDDLLQAKVPPSRIRSIKFENETAQLEDFNTGRIYEIKYDEKVLFVLGSLIKSTTELSGKVSKKAIKNIEETHGFTDESVIDIYPPADVYGFRIRSSGFDFSCLGEKMQRFAGTNMAQLTGELRSRFRSATFIDSFSTIAPLLSVAWPVDEIKQASNVIRGPLGGIQKQTLTLMDNTTQFTKFSRLQRHFI